MTFFQEFNKACKSGAFNQILKTILAQYNFRIIKKEIRFVNLDTCEIIDHYMGYLNELRST